MPSWRRRSDPLKWVIVSDGSTDGTDEIVSKYAADYPWIELLRMPERQERHFAGKVHAFNAGHARRSSTYNTKPLEAWTAISHSTTNTFLSCFRSWPRIPRWG